MNAIARRVGSNAAPKVSGRVNRVSVAATTLTE